MSLVAAAAVAAMLAAVLLVVVVITTYNTVVAMRRRSERAWANIDVALKQRYDELPNLVAAVSGQMGFERTVLDDVTRLRASYAPTAPLPEQALTASATTQAVRTLFAVVERYPDLRARQNVMALQDEISRLETLIARRRELFNEQVYQYNATISQLPAMLLADTFGWKPLTFFDADPRERNRPKARVFGA